MPESEENLLPSARENIEQLTAYHDREDAEVSGLQASIEAIIRFFGSPAYFVFVVLFIVGWVARQRVGNERGLGPRR